MVFNRGYIPMVRKEILDGNVIDEFYEKDVYLDKDWLWDRLVFIYSSDRTDSILESIDIDNKIINLKGERQKCIYIQEVTIKE